MWKIHVGIIIRAPITNASNALVACYRNKMSVYAIVHVVKQKIVQDYIPVPMVHVYCWMTKDLPYDLSIILSIIVPQENDWSWTLS